MADNIKDDASDEGFGLFVPMRFACLFIEHQRIGEGHRILGEIEAGRIEPVERIIPRRWPTGNAERIKAVNQPERFALAHRHTGILALGVDTDD
jgi:hypothetical protein